MYVSAQYCRNAGLGNKLFPWARSIVMAEKNEYTCIDPIWFSPRGAAITRGGIDYGKALRKIWLYDNFTRRKQDTSFLKGLFISRQHQTYCDNLSQGIAAAADKKNICFRWNTDHHFTDLSEYRAIIVNALHDISKPRSLAFAKSYHPQPFIGLNIRTGKDFVRKDSGKHGYYLTEIDWFIQALAVTRQRLGNLPAIIVSDGGEKELAAILQVPGTVLLNSRNAIEDLLVLSNCKVLLGSGNSSFSAWASFLGGMDTYSSQETSFAHFRINHGNDRQVVGTIE